MTACSFSSPVHGVTDRLPGGGDMGYLIPVDGDMSRLLSTGLPMSQVRDMARSLPAKHVFFAIDACYSGLMAFRVAPRSDAKIDVRQLTRKRLRQILTAGERDQPVGEEGGFGLFTKRFVEGLSGDADFNPRDGIITANELAAWIYPRVVTASNNQQTPFFGTMEGVGQFVFTAPGIGGDQPQAESELDRMRTKLEADRRQLEAEKRRLERRKLEGEQRKLEAERRRVEEENRRLARLQREQMPPQHKERRPVAKDLKNMSDAELIELRDRLQKGSPLPRRKLPPKYIPLTEEQRKELLRERDQLQREVGISEKAEAEKARQRKIAADKRQQRGGDSAERSRRERERPKVAVGPGTPHQVGRGLDTMVLVPAGWFTMGSESGVVNYEELPAIFSVDDEKPQRRVYLDAFYIDKYPVTNDRFWRFGRANHDRAGGAGVGQSHPLTFDSVLRKGYWDVGIGSARYRDRGLRLAVQRRPPAGCGCDLVSSPGLLQVSGEAIADGGRVGEGGAGRGRAEVPLGESVGPLEGDLG